MAYFRIRGGNPLKGSVTISGAKNAAVKMIVASLLTSEEVRLSGVPAIDDVAVDIAVVKSLGARVEQKGSEVRLRADDIGATEVPAELSSRTRAAVLALGPLLARFGKAAIPFPGGCPIGERPVDRHLAALEQLGAEIDCSGGVIRARADHLVGAPIRFEKTTVMGTENAILAAVLAAGETTILGAAQEPEVDDLIELLSKMGATVARSEEDPGKIVIQGVESLSGATHQIIPDRCEAVTFAVAAAATRGDIILENTRPQDLTAFLSKFEQLGASYEVLGDKVRVWADPAVEFSPAALEVTPHPGFMTDWQQPFSVLLAQAVGESTVHEFIYSQRFGYLSELSKMGVVAEVLTPSEAGLAFVPEKYGFDWSEKEEPPVVARITGPSKLHGAEVKISDLRAGATLVLAALAAEGESKVHGIEHIDRGYEAFGEKLAKLGADIERVNGAA